jgi:hypothetical protein
MLTEKGPIFDYKRSAGYSEVRSSCAKQLTVMAVALSHLSARSRYRLTGRSTSTSPSPDEEAIISIEPRIEQCLFIGRPNEHQITIKNGYDDINFVGVFHGEATSHTIKCAE